MTSVFEKAKVLEAEAKVLKFLTKYKHGLGDDIALNTKLTTMQVDNVIRRLKRRGLVLFVDRREGWRLVGEELSK
jgi:biotin operon repressor